MRWCVLQKNWFTIFSVKVTARAYIIKMGLCLESLLNCWSIGSQTWFDSTAFYARVSCLKMGLLYSRSRSQQRFKMTVCPIVSAQYLLNSSTIYFFFLPNFVLMYSIISQSILWKKMELLGSKSRSQRRFKMLVNVCQDDIF